MLFRSDRKSTRLNSSHLVISYAVFCLKKKKDTLDSLARGCHRFLVLGVEDDVGHEVDVHHIINVREPVAVVLRAEGGIGDRYLLARHLRLDGLTHPMIDTPINC